MTYIPPFDAAVQHWFFAAHTPALTYFFTIVAYFGSWALVLSLVLMLCAVFYTTPLQKYILPFLISIAVAETTTFILKILIARPRPLGGLVTESSYSFPSGHATSAVAFYGFLTYIAYKNIQNKTIRLVVVTLGGTMILLIGFCRLYLGVHYLSDVIAGYLAGLAGIFVGLYIYRRSFWG